MKKIIFILLFILFYCFVYSAIEVGPVTITAGTAQTFTFSYSYTATNGILIVSVFIKEPYLDKVLNIKFGNLSLTTTASKISIIENLIRNELWYIIDPTVGKNDIVVELTATTTVICIAFQLDNIDTNNPFYYETSMVGKNVTEMNIDIQQITQGLMLGIGASYSDAFAYVLPTQTELFNYLYNGMRAQAVYGFSTETGNITIPNYLNKNSTWTTLFFSIKAAQ